MHIRTFPGIQFLTSAIRTNFFLLGVYDFFCVIPHKLIWGFCSKPLRTWYLTINY